MSLKATMETMTILPAMAKVTWLDSGAHVDHGWASAKTHWAEGLSRNVVTVGQVMQEDDEVIAIGLNYDPDTENWYGVQLIYKPTIKSIEMLEYA